MLPPGKGVVCVTCREVTYPPAWLPPGGILGCFGPWAPRPADVTGRVATEAYIPAHIGTTPRGEGDPRCRETILGRGNHAPRSAASTRQCRRA